MALLNLDPLIVTFLPRNKSARSRDHLEGQITNLFSVVYAPRRLAPYVHFHGGDLRDSLVSSHLKY